MSLKTCRGLADLSANVDCLTFLNAPSLCQLYSWGSLWGLPNSSQGNISIACQSYLSFHPRQNRSLHPQSNRSVLSSVKSEAWGCSKRQQLRKEA